MSDLNRRELLKHAAAVAAATSVARLETRADAAQQPAAAPAGPPPVEQFFPAGFTRTKMQANGATINVVKGGQGPPLLLIHGAPQTHITWRLVAPMFAKTNTVVAPDLRGYGDSSKPADTPDHVNYSKRNMALDLVEVMKQLGFDRYPVIGQDRGGRVGHRLALDHPDKVTRLAVLDIVPTHYHYTHVRAEFTQAYFHWFNYLRPGPKDPANYEPDLAWTASPEAQLLAQAVAQKARVPMMNEAQREYYRATSDPANIHGMCEDYRAAASIDLTYDEADIKAGKKIACPVLALWSTRGPIGRLFDVMAIWKEYSKGPVTGKGLDGGHYLQEDLPNEVFAEISAFLKT